MKQKQATVGGNKPSATTGSGGDGRESKSIGVRAAAARIAAKQTPPHVVSTFSQNNISIASKFLSNTEVAALSQTCRLFNQRSQPALSYGMAPYVQRLLEHVVRGEQVEAEALLVKNPRLLLFNTGNTVDYSGRSIKGLSAWQAALCAGDVEMLAMMEPHFDSIEMSIPNPEGDPTVTIGEQIRLEQTHQVFPEGFEAHVAEQAAAETVFNFDAIVATIDGADSAQLDSAIYLKGAVLPATYASDEKTNDGAALELTTELNEFRQEFTKQSLNELIFNPQHLLRALEIYTAQYDGWHYKKCQVFWSQVIGFAQRFMPACYAQAFAQGLYMLVKVPGIHSDNYHPEVLKRSLGFRFHGGKFFSDGAAFLGFGALGFKFAAAFGRGTPWLLGWRPVIDDFARDFKILCQSKTGEFADLCQTRAATPASTLACLGR